MAKIWLEINFTSALTVGGEERRRGQRSKKTTRNY